MHLFSPAKPQTGVVEAIWVRGENVLSRGRGYDDRPYPYASDRYAPEYNDGRSWQAAGPSSVERDRMRYDGERDRRYVDRDRYDQRDGRRPDYPAAADPRDPRSRDGRDPYPARQPRIEREADYRYGYAQAPAYDRRPSWNEREREREYRERERVRSYHPDAADPRDPASRASSRAGFVEQWKPSPPSPHHSGSPRSSRRSSPSSVRRPSPSQAAAPPSGPRARRASPSISASRIDDYRHGGPGTPSIAPATTSAPHPSDGFAAAPPTGPRRSFGRLSSASAGPNRPGQPTPRASFDGEYPPHQPPPLAPLRTPSRTLDRSPYSADSPVQTPSAVAQQSFLQGPSAPAARDTPYAGRKSISYSQGPLRSPASAVAPPLSAHTNGSFSMPSTPAGPPPVDVNGKRLAWQEKEIKGSISPQLEAEAFTLSLDRIRGARKLNSHPAMQALRKALRELADSDVEVAGARTKTSVTEAALERAREQSEAWSIESGRIELEQRNHGVQGYWTTASSTAASDST